MPVKFKRDDFGNGPQPTSAIRMLGKSGCCSDDQYKAIASFLEDLLASEGPCGLLPTYMLGDWLNDIHVTQYEEMQIYLFHYVALTTRSYPYLETKGNGTEEIDNNIFVVQMPVIDGEHVTLPPASVDAETLWGVTEFPRVHMTQDHYYRAYCCQVMLDSLLLLVCVNG